MLSSFAAPSVSIFYHKEHKERRSDKCSDYSEREFCRAESASCKSVRPHQINAAEKCREGHYDPVWVVRFPFLEEQEGMEQKLRDILTAHQKELLSVYEAIQDKRDEYVAE